MVRGDRPELLDPALERRHVPIAEQTASQMLGDRHRRSVILPTSELVDLGQRRCRHMEASHAIAGVVGDLQQREQQLNCGRIGDQRAPFFTELQLTLPQLVREQADGGVASKNSKEIWKKLGGPSLGAS